MRTPLAAASLRCRTPLGRGRALRGRLREAARRALAVLCEWRRRRTSRAALASFDARMLRDIGLTRIDACNETNKPFWRE